MKSSELKNILLACGLAVFASVFAIGVNAAFGVTAPTISPDTAGLIGPTFSSVTTTDLDVRGDIVNGNVGNPVRVNGPFEATDTVTIENNTLIEGNVSVAGTISSPVTSGSNPNGNVRINDNLVVTGESWLTGITHADLLNSSSSINATGSVTAGINVSAVNVLTTLDVIAGRNVNGVNVDVSGLIRTAGNIIAGTTIDAGGAITADRFGTYTRYYSAATAVSASSFGSASYACASGTYLVSCGFHTDDGSTYSSTGYTRYITIARINPNISTNTCVVTGYNTASSARYLWAYAVCLNPET